MKFVLDLMIMKGNKSKYDGYFYVLDFNEILGNKVLHIFKIYFKNYLTELNSLRY